MFTKALPLLTAMIASVSAQTKIAPVYVVLPASNFTSAVNPSLSNPSPFNEATITGANFCTNSMWSSSPYWCENAPVGSTLASLTFEVILPNTLNYYIGLTYSTEEAASTIAMTIDGRNLVGDVPTPDTISPDSIATATATSRSGLLPAGRHVLQVQVTSGKLNIFNILISSTPIALTPVGEVPSDAIIVQTQSFTNAVAVINAKADQSFPKRNLANFCKNTIATSVPVWCFNAPASNTIKQSLDFLLDVPADGAYYFVMSYTSSAISNDVIIGLDGIYDAFGTIAAKQTLTLVTGGPAMAFALSGSTLAATISAGQHTITLKIMKGDVKIDFFYLTQQTVAGLNPVAEQANVAGSGLTLGTDAIIGIAVGAGCLVIIVVVIAVVLSRKTKSSAAPAATGTPAIAAMASGDKPVEASAATATETTTAGN